MSVLLVNDESFDKEVLESDQPVLVDFYADSCGPCRAIAPIVEQLSEEFGEVKFVKVDVANAYKVATKYRIASIPALMVFENGEIKDQMVGARTDKLRVMVESVSK
jgi:thioredoxin 1